MEKNIENPDFDITQLLSSQPSFKYVPYEELKAEEKTKVDEIVESYKKGETHNEPSSDDIENFITNRLSKLHLQEINEKVDKIPSSNSISDNISRMNKLLNDYGYDNVDPSELLDS